MIPNKNGNRRIKERNESSSFHFNKYKFHIIFRNMIEKKNKNTYLT